MKIRRLGWAGIELEVDGQSAVIDLFRDVGQMKDLIGEPHGPLPAPAAAPGTVRLALVTHLHEDHTDAGALATALAPDGVLLRPAPMEGELLEVGGTLAAERGLAKAGLATRIVEPWETVDIGPFRATAIPAADGFGDHQVSWIVEAGGRRILHAGDTLFHGWWWRAVMRTGPIDVAFLPVNGAIVSLPHRQPPSSLPAAMDPEQAAIAAAILQAREAIPMHYDTLHRAPVYVQVDGAAEAFVRACEARGVAARIVEAGALV